MIVRCFCDGCNTQFKQIEQANPLLTVVGGGTQQVPDIPLMVFEVVAQTRLAFCGWACLAAYCARKATTGIDWTFSDETLFTGTLVPPSTEEKTDG